MSRVSNESLLSAMNWRYAVKQFDATKKISEADWKLLTESLRLAPSSYGLQPWKFIDVQNPQIRKELRPVSWNQSQVEEASHFVVIAALEKLDEAYVQKYVNKVAQVRGVSAESLQGYRDMMIGDVVKGPRSEISQWWTQRQSYIAMGQMMYTAALMNIDTCPMEGIDPAAYDRILKLVGTGYKSVAAVAVGYRHADDKLQHAKKVRFDSSDIIQVLK